MYVALFHQKRAHILSTHWHIIKCVCVRERRGEEVTWTQTQQGVWVPEDSGLGKACMTSDPAEDLTYQNPKPTITPTQGERERRKRGKEQKVKQRRASMSPSRANTYSEKVRKKER